MVVRLVLGSIVTVPLLDSVCVGEAPDCVRVEVALLVVVIDGVAV